MPSDVAVDSHDSRPDIGTDYVPPKSSTERAIADVWQEMLGIGQIGLHDNFFELPT